MSLGWCGRAPMVLWALAEALSFRAARSQTAPVQSEGFQWIAGLLSEGWEVNLPGRLCHESYRDKSEAVFFSSHAYSEPLGALRTANYIHFINATAQIYSTGRLLCCDLPFQNEAQAARKMTPLQAYVIYQVGPDSSTGSRWRPSRLCLLSPVALPRPSRPCGGSAPG